MATENQTFTATEKAYLTKFNRVLEFSNNTKKIDSATGEASPHSMPIRQLMGLLQVASQEGLWVDSYDAAGDNRITRSKNLRALTNRGARARQNGFNFLTFKESPEDSRRKEVYLTASGREFVRGIVGLLKEFENRHQADK